MSIHGNVGWETTATHRHLCPRATRRRRKCNRRIRHIVGEVIERSTCLYTEIVGGHHQDKFATLDGIAIRPAVWNRPANAEIAIRIGRAACIAIGVGIRQIRRRHLRKVQPHARIRWEAAATYGHRGVTSTTVRVHIDIRLSSHRRLW